MAQSPKQLEGQVDDLAPFSLTVSLHTGETVQINEENAGVAAWLALHHIVSSGIAPSEWVIEAVSEQSLKGERLVWSSPPDIPEGIKSRVVAAIAECGVRIGRMSDGEHQLRLWTHNRDIPLGAPAESRPSTPPDWYLDFYERHLVHCSPLLVAIRPLIDQVRALASEEGLLYRGEGASYDGPIKSRLKREYDVDGETLRAAHNTIRREALRYVDHDGADFAAMEAQHMGMPTNFIDFTTEPMVALFFASRNIEGDGRVIGIRAEHKDYSVRSGIACAHHRIKAQRGVFVESPTGVIPPRLIVRQIAVPKQAKRIVESYLTHLWGLDRPAMFRDLSGLADEFSDGIFRLPRAIFADGASAIERGDFHRAINRFSEYIASSSAQRPSLHLGGIFNKPAYFNRAIALHAIGKTPEAIADLESAKEIETAHPPSGGPDMYTIDQWLQRLRLSTKP